MKCNPLHISRQWIAVTLLVLGIAAHASAQAKADSSDIGARIDQLRQQLDDAENIESTLSRRRALKNVSRDADQLASEHADSPQRFGALALLFDAQRDLLLLRNDDESRKDLLDTCHRLTDAPDAYAKQRLQADFLLMRIELDAQGATNHQRAVAIAELADNYRDTSAEVDSLMVGCETAFNLGRSDLLEAFRDTLSIKFSKNMDAIAFLRDRFAHYNRNIVFHGRYARPGGEEVVFPFDRLGHAYMLCFWSRDARGLADRVAEIKALQSQYPGRFEVFSFNLDQLPDAGADMLKSFGVDWTPLRLPGGINNPIYKAIGGTNDFYVRISNLNGYMTLSPIDPNSRGGDRIKDLADYLNTNLELPQYLAMFQSLRAGEFLIQNPAQPFDPKSPPELDAGDQPHSAASPDTVPDDALKAIQAWFVAPPMRYRLSESQAMEKFQQCLTLCGKAIAKHPSAGNLWAVYNRRIIAQIALFYALDDPKFLRQAAEDAGAVLRSNAPAGAKLPAQFCLALQALRQSPDDASVIITKFQQDVSGGRDALSSIQLAAATVLAMNGMESNLIREDRDKLLADHMDDPRIGSLVTCLYDQSTFSRLFRPNIWGVDVMKRAGMRWYGWPDDYSRKFGPALRTLDGKPMTFPDPNPDSLSVAVFIEPPADEQAAQDQKDLLTKLQESVAANLTKHLNVAVIFVQGTPDAIRQAAQEAGWDGPIAVVPGGLANPDVLRLGIFAADIRPNTFIVKSDGDIRWSMTGMNHHTTSTSAVAGLVRNYTADHDMQVGERAMTEGDYKKALRMFSGSFAPGTGKQRGFSDQQHFDRARAFMAMGDYQSALNEYDPLVAAHEKSSARRLCACDSLADILNARASIYEQAGDAKLAEPDRRRAEQLTCPAQGRKTHIGIERNQPAIQRQLLTYQSSKDWKAAIDYLTGIIHKGQDGRQGERDDFAKILKARSEALDKLGQADAVKRDRLRAQVLTEGIEAPPTDTSRRRHERRSFTRYVDAIDDAQ